MKKIAILLGLTMLLTLAGCGEAQAGTPTGTHPSTVISETTEAEVGIPDETAPVMTEPPALTVLCAGESWDAFRGTYTWTWPNLAGTSTTVCADSVHPLEYLKDTEPFEPHESTARLSFASAPDEIQVRCWSDTYLGQSEGDSQSIDIIDGEFRLLPDGYVYEIIATWNDPDNGGTCCYGFYGRGPHEHVPTPLPLTVDDPVTGYCGNTMTTVYVDGEEYSFMGSDSVSLTDLLINLAYDPEKLCRCLPEYTVETEWGTYGLSLSGYARCDQGQAELTQEQLDLAREILSQLNAPEE